MDQTRAGIISKWLLAMRGETTQDAFLEDLAAVTGWKLKRSSLSKYENARAVPWPDTLAKFERYAKARGKPGPDFTPPTPAEDPVIAAMDRQTKAITALVGELREWRTADRDRLGAVERTAELLAARLLPVSGAEGSPARRVPRESAG